MVKINESDCLKLDWCIRTLNEIIKLGETNLLGDGYRVSKTLPIKLWVKV